MGASLGADSIKEGVTAAVVGVLLVMAFMLFYYRGSGINADLALFLNLVILLGFMGFSGATLTLPGIAGVILTIGMGVDSNVLIFERIREEVRAGKVPSAAVDQGFAHAWTTIFDTHVTTIVSAAHPVPVRNRTGEGFRGDADVWSCGEPVHRGLCLACDLRGAPEQAEARGAGVDLGLVPPCEEEWPGTENAGARAAPEAGRQKTSGIVSQRKYRLAGEEVVFSRLFLDLQRGRY